MRNGGERVPACSPAETGGAGGSILHHILMMLLLTLVGTVVGTLGIVSLPAGLSVGGFWFAMTLQCVGGLWFGAWGVAAGTLMGFMSNVLSGGLPVYVLGLVPANFVQSFLAAWVFRRWRLDPALRSFRDVLVFIAVGPLLSNLIGAGLGMLALSSAGQLSGPEQVPQVLLGWVVGNGLPCLLLGIPLLKSFTSQVVASPFYCTTWWEGNRPMRWRGLRYGDLPVAARLLVDFFLAGVAPMLVVAILDTIALERRGPRIHRPEIPVLLNLSIFLSLIVAGLASRRMRARLAGLMEGVRHLSEGDLGYRVPDLGRDEVAEVGRAFNSMAGALAASRDELRATTEARARDVRELEIARDIQQGFLPREYPAVPGLTFAARTKPARTVGGDFYDFIPMADGRWGVLVADVSGKGVPAALLTGLCRALIRSRASAGASPAEILRAVNALMASDNPGSMYVTCFLAVLDGGSGRLVYANAGHNPALLITPEAAAPALLPATGTPLGLLPDRDYTQAEVACGPGATLLLYTDGVTDAFGAGGESFGDERLAAVAHAKSDAGPASLLDALDEAVASFSEGQPQSDDMTMVAVHWIDRGGAPR